MIHPLLACSCCFWAAASPASSSAMHFPGLIQLLTFNLATSPKPAAPAARTGVFVGISWTEYTRMASDAGVPVSVYTAQGAVLSVCPGGWRAEGGLLCALSPACWR